MIKNNQQKSLYWVILWVICFSTAVTLTKTLAMVLSPKIRVNAVGPGPTFPSKYQTKKGFDRQVQSTILKKRIKTQDICNAIDLLLSNQTITGQMIATDSGQHLRWNKNDADFINNKKK